MLDTIKSFFRERLHFAKSKGVLKIQIVLDQGMGFFKWCYKIQLCVHQENFRTARICFAFATRDFQKIFSCRRLWGHLKFTERDITGAAVSSIDL